MSQMTIIEGNNNNKDDVRVIMVKGEKGYSAYDIYVQNGGTLTEEEWLNAFLNADNFYSKSETDDLLDNKADKGTSLADYGITNAYTKTETDNLISGAVTDSYSTSTTKAYSANYINNLTQPETIFCNTAQDVDYTSTAYTDISNWVKVSGVGQNLTVSDGKIVIGQGITHIRVTYKLWAEASSVSELLYTYGRKNSTNVTGSWQIHYLVASQAQSVFNQFEVDVQENDVITVSVYGNETIAKNTSIIVEKIY